MSSNKIFPDMMIMMMMMMIKREREGEDPENGQEKTEYVCEKGSRQIWSTLYSMFSFCRTFLATSFKLCAMYGADLGCDGSN